MRVALVGARQRVVHEHDVGVRAVSEFLAAVATHPHDDELDEILRLDPVDEHSGSRHREGRLDRGIRDGAQSWADIIHGQQAEAVGSRDPEQFPAPRGTDRGDRHLRIDLTQSCGERLRLDVLRGPRRQLVVVGKDLHRFRRAQQQVGGEPRRGQ